MPFNFTVENPDPYNLEDFYESYLYTTIGLIIMNFVNEIIM